MTPIQSIRKYCLDCVGNSREVKLCPSEECPLWIYRLGKNPARRGIGKISNLRGGKAKRYQTT